MNSRCAITKPMNPKIARKQAHVEPVIRIMSSSQLDFRASTIVSMTFLYTKPFGVLGLEVEAAFWLMLGIYCIALRAIDLIGPGISTSRETPKTAKTFMTINWFEEARFIAWWIPQMLAANAIKPPIGLMGVSNQLLPIVQGQSAIARQTRKVEANANWTSLGEVCFRFMSQEKRHKPT